MEQYCCEVEPENVPDLVAVVRCKDCKHIEHLPWLDDANGRAVICKKHNFTGLRTDDWFCADGEPKDKQLAYSDNDTAQYADAPHNDVSNLKEKVYVDKCV